MVTRAPDADLVEAVAVPVADNRQVGFFAEGRNQIGAPLPSVVPVRVQEETSFGQPPDPDVIDAISVPVSGDGEIATGPEGKYPVNPRIPNSVAVEIEDRPGTLARLLKPILDARVNTDYMYAFTGFTSGKAVMVFRFGDNDKAIEILRKGGIRLLDAKAFGMLENAQ